MATDEKRAAEGHGLKVLNFVREMRTASPAMEEVYRTVRTSSETDSPVLINGETGTGKGILARLVHNLSTNAGGPFVMVNCAALPESLVENELFGHAAGAFTGAERTAAGLFQQAHTGTILLDEIGALPWSAQAKLLNVLEEKEFHPLGTAAARQVDVRVIAATNADLPAMTRDGRFRRDLYYRLAVVEVDVPPLRKRREDLPALIEFSLQILDDRCQRGIRRAHPEVAVVLSRHDWPGNIRELRSVIERAYLVERGTVLTMSSIPKGLTPVEYGPSTRGFRGLLSQVRREAGEKAAAQHVRILMAACEGDLREVAGFAGVSVRHIRNLVKRHRIGGS